jgi:hypothetical protein
VLKKALIEGGYESFYDLDDSATAIPLTSHSLDELYARLGDADRGAATDLLVLRNN